MGSDDPMDPSPDQPARGAVASSVRWSAAAVLGRQVPQLFAALVLARILGPDAYGIVSAATVYVTFTTLLLDQGLAAALVQRPAISSRLPGAVASANILSSVLLAGATALAAPAVSAFFNAPTLEPLLVLLGAGLLLKGIAVAPRAMQQRRLGFRTIGIADITGGLLGAAAGVGAALLGAGTWALAWQVLVTDTVIAASLQIATRGVAPNLRLHELGTILPFSLRIFGSNALAFLSRNVDNILVGRFLGVGALSLYSMSYRVLVIPVQMIGLTVNRVVFPIFSRLHDQPALLAKGLLKAIDVLAVAAIPSMALVSVAAPELVSLVLGPQWGAAAPLLSILAIAGAKETVFYVTGPLMRARGEGKLIFRYEWLATGVQVTGIVAGLPFGVLGVAIGWTAAGFALTPVQLIIQRRMCGVAIRDQGGRILPYVHASAWGALAYLGIRLFGAGDLVTFLIGSTAYILLAVIVLLLCHRAALDRSVAATMEILRIRRGPRTPPAPV